MDIVITPKDVLGWMDAHDKTQETLGCSLVTFGTVVRILAKETSNTAHDILENGAVGYVTTDDFVDVCVEDTFEHDPIIKRLEAGEYVPVTAELSVMTDASIEEEFPISVNADEPYLIDIAPALDLLDDGELGGVDDMKCDLPLSLVLDYAVRLGIIDDTPSDLLVYNSLYLPDEDGYEEYRRLRGIVNDEDEQGE